MARATKFRIGHAINQENKVQIDKEKRFFDTTKNYSNGRGGLFSDFNYYISKIVGFIEDYYEITTLYPDSTSQLNKIHLPLTIARFKEQLTQNIYVIRNQKARHTVGRKFLNETFEYQWYIDENFQVSMLKPDGQIEKNITDSVLNEVNERIKQNEDIIKISDQYKYSEFSKKLEVQKKIRDKASNPSLKL